MGNLNTTNLWEPVKGEYRDCVKCSFETFDDLIECPTCHIKLDPESKIRNAGTILKILGGFLALLISFIIAALGGLVILGAVTGDLQKNSSHGEPFGFLVMFFVLLLILGYSVAIYLAGRSEFIHGRRDRRKLRVAAVMIGLVMVLGIIIQVFTG